jgi:predicted nucleic acid-binding protein
MRAPRLYIDASVIGGCFDEEFAEDSEALLQMAEEGRAVLLVSDVLALELDAAPPRVRERFGSLPPECLELLQRSDESAHLRDAYLQAGVVGPQSRNDAHHVALATIARADVLVSWNFRHLVRVDKIRGFNAVNLREGYGMIDIRSPKEIV